MNTQHTHRLPRRDVFGLAAIWLVFVALAVAWNLSVPPYENLDELEHLEVVRHIAVTGRLPVHGEAEAAGFDVRQEASQPPLYHVLAAGWTRLLGLSLQPHSPDPIKGSLVACGSADTLYNKATWRPDLAGWAETPSRRAVHLTRLFSTLLQSATLAGVWLLARRAFPRGAVPLLATAITAYNPQFLLVAAGVNNDNTVIPLAVWGVLVAFDIWQDGPSTGKIAAMGILSGLAGLSKLSGLGLLGLGGLALLLYAWRARPRWTRLAGWLALLIVPAVALILPWALRNLHLYGDATALAPMLAKVGVRDYPTGLGELRLMFLSYWGQLPCSFYPRGIYFPYIALSAGGIAGLARGWRRFTPKQRMALGWCALWFAVIALAWYRWNRMTPAPGGRLLFPAAGAAALLLAAGVQGWRCMRRAGVRVLAAVLIIWAWITLIAGPVRLFTPPATVGTIPQTAQKTEIVYGDAVALGGFQARVRTPWLRCVAVSRAYCGPALDVTLYWRRTAPVEADWTLVLQMVSPAPGNTTLRLNYNHWPGRGTIPLATWPVKDGWVRDRVVLPLGREGVTQAWKLTAGFVDDHGARIAAAISGAPSGETLVPLAILRVPGRDALDIPQGQLTAQVRFGGVAILKGAQITPASGGAWSVDLLWEARAASPDDYTVFVHAYDKDGVLLQTGDGPPLEGAYPTSLWKRGDHIADTHVLQLGDLASRVATIAVGLYEPLSGERLPAVQDGEALLNNAVIIWKAQP